VSCRTRLGMPSERKQIPQMLKTLKTVKRERAVGRETSSPRADDSGGMDASRYLIYLRSMGTTEEQLRPNTGEMRDQGPTSGQDAQQLSDFGPGCATGARKTVRITRRTSSGRPWSTLGGPLGNACRIRPEKARLERRSDGPLADSLLRRAGPRAPHGGLRLSAGPHTVSIRRTGNLQLRVTRTLAAPGRPGPVHISGPS
jgi:hypothetical protein